MIRLNISQPNGYKVKSIKEMDLMREAGRVVFEVKKRVVEAIRPGVTTKELDRIAEETIMEMGAKPSFKGYTAGGHIPFPATICASINEEIVHGIPCDRVLQDGDILSVDFGAIVSGFHGDSAFTIGVGQIDDESQRLIDATRESLKRGIAQVKAGARVGDISAAIQSYAEGQGYSVVRQYVGHGIGRALHEDPQIPNYGSAGRGPLLRKGMTIAIEPMLNVGGWETEQLDDGWTVVTLDRTLSAHFEDSVAITADGSENLTTIEGYEF